MTQTQLDDLKDFVTVTVGQTEQRLTDEMRKGFEGVAETIDRHNDEIDGLDKRVEKLEGKLV